MLPQSESGNERAMTYSGVSEGTITLTDGANQKQDLASLKRDTTDLNGTVNRTPDLQELLNDQSRLMSAATAAGEAVARDIGTYASKKEDEARKLAEKATDPELQAQYLQEAENWKEGGDYRALMHAAGGAIVAGLGGGNALGGALGAGATSKLGDTLNKLSADIKNSRPTGKADVDEALAQIVATGIGTAVGAAAGGSSGAFTGFNTDRYNRQLHEDEKAAIRKKANGDPELEKRLTAAACYRVECWAEYSRNSAECLKNYVSPQDVIGLKTELEWVDGLRAASGSFDYSALQRIGDSKGRQFDEAGRGARRIGKDAVGLVLNPQRALGEVVGQMQDDARTKASEGTANLIAQGVANGLDAVIGAGGRKPPNAGSSPALAIGAKGAEGAGAVGTLASLPDNVFAAGRDKNRLPIPDVTKGENGLQVESNPKHTPGMDGNSRKAGAEPKNSLNLFNSSVASEKGNRYAIDAGGNINRFSPNGMGVYHWSGSTGDLSVPLDVSSIPIGIRRAFGFKGK